MERILSGKELFCGQTHPAVRPYAVYLIPKVKSKLIKIFIICLNRLSTKKKSIHAPASKVWKVLVKKQYIKKWIYEFSEGNAVTDDWHLNANIAMTDDDGTVFLEGTITEFEPNRRLKVEIENSDYTEELSLTDKGNLTLLSIHAGPVARTEHDEHSEVWEKGLNKIKELSEA